MRQTGRTAADELIVRGSLLILKRRCGKPNCHCAHDEPHTTPALSYSVKGSTKMLTFRPEDLPQVKAALARYYEALARLDRRALQGITSLRARIADEKAGRRARRSGRPAGRG